jgi:hypothetical protein
MVPTVKFLFTEQSPAATKDPDNNKVINRFKRHPRVVVGYQTHRHEHRWDPWEKSKK